MSTMLKPAFFHVFPSLLFALGLAIIYHYEISRVWAYWGFEPYRSFTSIAISFVLIFITSTFIPATTDTRGIALALIYYIFFIPSFLSLATFSFKIDYLIAICASFIIIVGMSAIKFKPFRLRVLKDNDFLAVNMVMLISVILLLIIFGGLNSFNLNIFSVYEFRREAFSNLPSAFGYIFSGTSKIIIPIILVFAIKLRSWPLALMTFILITFLFGMTHHKSVLFIPIGSAALFAIMHYRKSMRILVFAFLALSLVSIFEIIYFSFAGGEFPALFSNLIVRRVFFVPPFLDQVYLDYFVEKPKYLWSTSRFGLGLASNPYDLTSALLIGNEVFTREGLAANTGMVGSGFAQAGHTGILIYTVLIGAIIAFLHAYGKVIGHKLIVSISGPIIITVVTSSDLSTAILSHGIALLFLTLLVFPRKKYQKFLRGGTQ